VRHFASVKSLSQFQTKLTVRQYAVAVCVPYARYGQLTNCGGKLHAHLQASLWTGTPKKFGIPSTGRERRVVHKVSVAR
jgi:hypothetical protein